MPAFGSITPRTRCSGSRRCMWGNNFPIEKLWTDLRTLLSTWQNVPAGRSAEEIADVFGATANRVYRLC
ncbi:putative TIM-barrel fold metal-dependent hydrolase [Nonomuraea muscovyensis]|uniref:Putative TIM-barrel fold metal-dependent hydrolase n=1 Tax=Nonomuraea muscovyensis TaxID=1124761 RepID=A0A7X0C2Y5_9ACTN|nr:hypothetical protein [Nonomuraea muscovyensis]MBB6347518.1 putative TIM-barrel fold metal-dependent hydrolase [Nonomuraea muscovyensis]